MKRNAVFCVSLVVAMFIIIQGVVAAGNYTSDSFPPMESKIIPTVKSILHYKGPYFNFLGKHQVVANQYVLYFQIFKKNGLNVEQVTLTKLDSGVWIVSNAAGELRIIK